MEIVRLETNTTTNKIRRKKRKALSYEFWYFWRKMDAAEEDRAERLQAQDTERQRK